MQWCHSLCFDCHGTGHDFDMTEYEMLNVEPPAPTPTQPQPALPRPDPTTPQLSPPESFEDKSAPPPESSEEPQEKEEFASSASLQFRFKRRAPEVPLLSDG